MTLRRLSAAVAATLLLAASIVSAAVTATPVFIQTPKLGRIQILNGTGAYAIASGAATVTNTVAAYTCGANGSKITGIIASSNDSASRELTVFMVPASNVPYIITTATIPITAGQLAGTPPVSMLSATNAPGLPMDSDGNPYLLCESGDVIRVGVKVAVTSNLVVTVLVVASDF